VEAQYRETFARLAAQQDAEIDLARAALLVCRMAYPELDEGHYLGEMERLGTLARERSGGHDGFAAAEGAHGAFAAAARAAGDRGPGSFWPAFLDALAAHG